MITLRQLNEASLSQFTKILQEIFEHSPWIPKEAAKNRPFSSRAALHEAMVVVVEEAAFEDQLSLIQAHPKLGDRKKMSAVSTSEQKKSGLSDLSDQEYEDFESLNLRYEKKFGFPFIKAVKGFTKREIYDALQERLQRTKEREFQQSLHEIYEIAHFRLVDLITEERKMTMTEQRSKMSYGKGNVFAYRTFMPPLTGLRTIPESSFAERDNTVFGVDITVEIGGEAFLPSFSEGDNGMVVATDSMKNFIQRHLGSFDGKTVEGFVRYVSERFLDTYDHIDWVKMTGESVPFEGTVASDLVYKRSRNERTQATIELERVDGKIKVTHQESEILDLQLVKVKDNSFVGFIRDEYTTLPEDSNRPLFVYLSLGWVYENDWDASGEEALLYVPWEQVQDIASTIFHEVQSPSIQSLIYHIGCRVLERFPQLKEVIFESQNRTWDMVVEDIPGTEGKVYTEPRLPYGFQRFSVTKDDLEQGTYERVVKESSNR